MGYGFVVLDFVMVIFVVVIQVLYVPSSNTSEVNFTFHSNEVDKIKNKSGTISLVSIIPDPSEVLALFRNQRPVAGSW